MPTASRPVLARWRLALWGGAALLLLLPAVAMRFTAEIRWDAGDFVLFAAMLAIACGVFEAVMRLTEGRLGRWLAGGAIVAAFLLIWAELAVGLLH